MNINAEESAIILHKIINVRIFFPVIYLLIYRMKAKIPTYTVKYSGIIFLFKILRAIFKVKTVLKKLFRFLHFVTFML